MLDVAQDMTGQNRGIALVENVIPLIRSLSTISPERAQSQKMIGSMESTMKEAEAGHRMQQLRNKVTAALAEHHHETRLARRALQHVGSLPDRAGVVNGLSAESLQNILDYLRDDKFLRDAITSSVLQSIGGQSPHRTRTICLDPDAQIAAILQSQKGIAYEGDVAEQSLCLVPLGAALVAILVKYFQPSMNREIMEGMEGLRSLTFQDSRQRLDIGPAYSRLAQLLASISRSGMAFNVSVVYNHLADAMSKSTDAARDAGEWRRMCFQTLRTRQIYPINTPMPRVILDETMALLRDLMDTEADNRGLLEHAQLSASAGATAMTMVVSASEGGGMYKHAQCGL